MVVDDLDQRTESVKTLVFIVDGKSYEIDLGEKNLERFHRVLEPFTSVARSEEPVKRATPKKKARKSTKRMVRAKAETKSKTSTRTRTAQKTGPTPNQIRTWAHEVGYPVGKAGRVSKAARAAFLEAHATKPTTDDLQDASEKGALSNAA